MKYRELDIVTLRRDIPEHRLKAGDRGTIVFVYEPDGVEVEFVLPTGETRALLTLNISDISARPTKAEAPH